MALTMSIGLTGIPVQDPDHAVDFYTGTLGFSIKTDLPMGEFRFVTVTAPGGPAEVELLLEPTAHPASAAFQKTIYDDGIPAAVFFVKDLEAECEQLKAAGVRFHAEPAANEFGASAVIDDTCGNLIQLHQR